MIWPWKVEVRIYHSPWPNWLLAAFTVLVHVLVAADILPDRLWHYFILDDWGAGVLGHVLLHAGWFHLLVNMWALWVFGNAVAHMLGGGRHVLNYLVFAAFAGVVHLLFFTIPAIGASGAIWGVIGLAGTLCPRAKVVMAWWFFFRAGTFRLPLWILALVYLGLNLLDWYQVGIQTVAHHMHIAGLVAGVGVGLCLRRTERDESEAERA